MAKQITSTDWHLEGVSVEARKLLTQYIGLRGDHIAQGTVVDEILRTVLPGKIGTLVESQFSSFDGPNPHGATDGC